MSWWSLRAYEVIHTGSEIPCIYKTLIHDDSNLSIFVLFSWVNSETYYQPAENFWGLLGKIVFEITTGFPLSDMYNISRRNLERNWWKIGNPPRNSNLCADSRYELTYISRKNLFDSQTHFYSNRELLFMRLFFLFHYQCRRSLLHDTLNSKKSTKWSAILR